LKIEKVIQKITFKNKSKFYSSKFPVIKSESITTMFAGFSKFLEVKKKYDPENLFWSDAIDFWF